jgi:hypothetical protein
MPAAERLISADVAAVQGGVDEFLRRSREAVWLASLWQPGLMPSGSDARPIHPGVLPVHPVVILDPGESAAP